MIVELVDNGVVSIRLLPETDIDRAFIKHMAAAIAKTNGPKLRSEGVDATLAVIITHEKERTDV